MTFTFLSCSKQPSEEEKKAEALRQEAHDASTGNRTGDARRLMATLLALDVTNGNAGKAAEDEEMLAANYAATADYDSAFMFAEESYKGYRAVADKYAGRRIRVWTASLLRSTGQERKALEMLTEMLRISRVLDDMQGVTELSWDILPSYRVLDMRTEENETLTELLNTAQEAGSLPMQAKVYYEWGNSHYYRREFGEAMSNYLRAFTLADQAHDSLFAVSALSSLAIAYEKDGNRQEAFRTFTEGLTRSDLVAGADRIREEMLVRVGNIYLLDGQYEEAERFYKAALTSAVGQKNKLAEGYLFLHLGHCAMRQRGRREEGAKDYQIALDLFTSYQYTPGVAYALASMGIAELESGNSTAALGHLTEASRNDVGSLTLPGESDLYTECEAAFYRSRGRDLHEAFLEVLLLLGKYDEAFAESEKRHGEELSEVFGSFSFDTGQQETTAALWESQRFKAMQSGALRELAHALSSSSGDEFVLSALPENAGKYEKLAGDAAQRLEGSKSDLKVLLSGTAVTVTDVQQALPPDAVLLTAVPTTRSVFLFAIGKSRWTVQLSAVEKSRLSRYIDDYNSLMVGMAGADSIDASRARAQQARLTDLNNSLYLALVRPVESFIENAGRLIVVPFGDLVPYHALKRAPGSRNSPYLIQQYQFSYLPSAASLLLIGSPLAAPVDIVALGYAGNTDWDVEYELRDIRAFYKDARLYFGKDATFSTLQKEHAGILNLALPFSFDPWYPGNSSVMFSNGQNVPGPLQVQWGKILSLPPFPTIIISDLSDHATIPRSEPFVFLLQGSQSVIMTQYSAHRKTKKYFGELFYTAVTSGRPADVAYTNALRGMIDSEEYSSPSVWATFVRWGK